MFVVALFNQHWFLKNTPCHWSAAPSLGKEPVPPSFQPYQASAVGFNIPQSYHEKSHATLREPHHLLTWEGHVLVSSWSLSSLRLPSVSLGDFLLLLPRHSHKAIRSCLCSFDEKPVQITFLSFSLRTPEFLPETVAHGMTITFWKSLGGDRQPGAEVVDTGLQKG